MVDLYTTKNMTELIELIDVVGNKTDSFGQTILANTYFSKDSISSRNSYGKVRAQVPIDVNSVSGDYNETNSVVLFTMADPIFYEGGVLDMDLPGFNNTYNNFYELEGLEGKALFDKSIELSYNPAKTMSNFITDWERTRGLGNDLGWTETGDNVKSKRGIYNLIQEHLASVNEKYHLAMHSSNISDSIKNSYARMTNF